MHINAASILLLVGLASHAVADSGYMDSCYSNDWAFTADLADPNWMTVLCNNQTTYFALDTCLGNNDGHVVGQLNGGFSGSCKDVKRPKGKKSKVGQLHMKCENNKGKWKSTWIDMNTVLGYSGDTMSVSCFGTTLPLKGEA